MLPPLVAEHNTVDDLFEEHMANQPTAYALETMWVDTRLYLGLVETCRSIRDNHDRHR